MKSNIVCALGFIFILGIVSSSADFEAGDDGEEDSRSGSDHNTAVVPLEHALSATGEFSVRGKLTYRGPKLVTSKSRRLVSVHVEQSRLSRDDLYAIQKLADENQLYRVRIQSNVNDPNSPKVMASIPACLLLASNFHELFRIHVDQYGNIRSLWYQVAASHCSAGARVPKDSVQLVTSLSVDMDSKGPRLPIEPVVRVEKETQEKEAEQPSFLRKYGLYMAGGMLLLMMMSGDEEKGQGRAGGAGGPARAGRAK